MFLAYAMEHYSILGVLWLEDKQGLGKTKQGIMLAWLNLVLNITRQSCNRFWRDGVGQRHLANDETNFKARCPSSAYWLFRCRCEPGSAARNCLPRTGPSLVICLAGSVMGKWCAEVNTLAKSTSPFKLKSISAHNSIKLRPSSAFLLFAEHPKAKSSDPAIAADKFACGADGSCRQGLRLNYVVIFTEQSVEKQVFRLVGAQQPITSAYHSSLS
jgi:hypothetical protein